MMRAAPASGGPCQPDAVHVAAAADPELEGDAEGRL